MIENIFPLINRIYIYIFPTLIKITNSHYVTNKPKIHLFSSTSKKSYRTTLKNTVLALALLASSATRVGAGHQRVDEIEFDLTNHLLGFHNHLISQLHT